MNLPQDLPALLAAALDAQLMRQGALLSVKEAASGRYAHVNDAMAAFFDRAAQSIRGSTDVDLVGASAAANSASLPMDSDSRLASAMALSSRPCGIGITSSEASTFSARGRAADCIALSISASEIETWPT